MERREFLVGTAAAVAGVATQPAAAHYYDNVWVKSPPGQPLSPSDIESASFGCANNSLLNSMRPMSRMSSFHIFW